MLEIVRREQLREKIKDRIGQMPYKYVISLGILTLIGIMLIVFGIYLWMNWLRECRETAGREADNSAVQIVGQVDERLDNLKQYYISFADEDDFTWVVENRLRYSDYTKNKAAQESMTGKKIFMDYIGNYAFVNFRTGWILGSAGMFPLNQVDNVEVLEELFQRNGGELDKSYWTTESIVVKRVMNYHYHTEVEDKGISLVMKLPNPSVSPAGIFVVNINMNTWRRWVNRMLGGCEEIVVLDEDGQLIHSTDESLVETCMELQAKGLPDGHPTESKLGGVVNGYMISARTSELFGWRYYVCYDIDRGQTSGGPFPGIVLLSMMVFVAICFFMTSWMLYRPVGRLVRGVSEEGQKITGNELEFLADKFMDMKNDRQAMESLMKQRRGKLLELFELRLIRGEVRFTDEWSEYFEGLHLRQSKYYAAAVIVLNLRDESETRSNVDEDAICLKMVDELPETLKELTWMPVVYNACAIFCLFGEDDEGVLLERIMEFYDGIQIFAEEHYGYRILMGVSATHTQMKHVRAACRESISALTMEGKSRTAEHEGEAEEGEGPYTGREDCRFFLSSSTVRGNTFKNTYEKDIQNSIKAMDKDQCYKIIDEFCAGLRGETSGDRMVVYTLRMVNSILSAAIDTAIDIDKLYPDGLKRIYDEMISVMEPSRVRRQMKYTLIDPILRARSMLLENNSYSMLQDIERQVLEHKGNITLTECAEALGVHPTYIWKILKMEKGKSFSDYVEEYKLEEAMRLLLQTDLSVAEIATALNYTNAQNFIRFFSKSTGVTPGKFRKLY